MNKIRTVGQLQNELDREFAWRLKEIADLKSAVRQQAKISEKTLVRAGVALLYAHWEGFVKTSAEAYLNYVDSQGAKLDELTDCFVALGFKRKLGQLDRSGRVAIGMAAASFFRTAMDQRADLRTKTAIDSKSNLNSEVFREIARTVGLDTVGYEKRFNLIDESLLARRNRIAHGEYLDIEADAWRNLADDVISLLRQFKTDIENAASMAQFRRSRPNAAAAAGMPADPDLTAR